MRTSGHVKRPAPTPQAAAELFTKLNVVVGNLPSPGESIDRFAARVTGDAHALDDDRPLATPALRVARVLSGLPEGSGAEWRREVWASVGLMRDELSTTVITLGFRGHRGLEAAVMQLLRLIVAGNGTLRHHGDFDRGGIRIANVLHDRVPFTPWRFDTRSYLTAGDAGRPLTDAPVEARWDPSLAPAISHTGRRVEKELVPQDLLNDLSS